MCFSSKFSNKPTFTDTDKRDELTTGFALVANLAMEAAWGPLQTMTVELYPTVIRLG